MRTAAFTIIAPNYRHFARVLMASVERHEPEWERFVLVVGGTGDLAEVENFSTVLLDALPLPDPRRFAFRYNLLELSTAVKPWMFEQLFARGFDRVVYLDPDVELFSPLDELDPAAFITLTPHLTAPMAGEHHPSEQSILQAGTYNLGFLAVTRTSALDRFLAWWKEKLEFHCIVDLSRGLFVDQKWMDLAPALFPAVAVLRHEGYNVAYWNLAQRRLEGEAGHLTVNGVPLRFFHFSGFDPSNPAVLSRHQHESSVPHEARSLFDRYAAAVHARGYWSFRGARYAYATFADATPVANAARAAYRDSLALQSAAGDDPFAHPELFRTYRDPHRRGRLTRRAALLSYRVLSSARPLVRLLPPSARLAMREFILGRREAPAAASRAVPALPGGINIVGYAGRDTGVGESARLFGRSCAAAGIEHQFIDLDVDGGRAVWETTIYHVNADRTLEVRTAREHLFAASRFNIGLWHWELPELPEAWAGAADVFDEMWAPSAFIESGLSRQLPIPVVHMPHGVEVTEIAACSPSELGVEPGRFTFLCMFDLGSVMERKNPLGVLDAFRRAFGDRANVSLLMKVGRAAEYPDDYRELTERVGGIPNVVLSDRMLPRPRVNGLLASCDAVVSLHRSEGFGLVLAEAMCLGKPVIATGWSGNMDFMTPANSCLVGYELVALERQHEPYAAGQQWAAPDVEQAASLMRQVADDSAFAARIGDEARRTMKAGFSHAVAGERYRRRLAMIEGRSGAAKC